MSDELSKLPPQVQERLMRLQQLQQTLQTILQQKQQVDMEAAEIDQTLAELQKTADDAVIYKAAGSPPRQSRESQSNRRPHRTQRPPRHKNHSYGTARRTHAQPTQRTANQAARRPQPCSSAAAVINAGGENWWTLAYLS